MSGGIWDSLLPNRRSSLAAMVAFAAGSGVSVRAAGGAQAGVPPPPREPIRFDPAAGSMHVRAFGAVGDDKTIDTDAFREALDYCRAGTARRAGQGIPLDISGGIYRVGPLTLHAGNVIVGGSGSVGQAGHAGASAAGMLRASGLKPGQFLIDVPDDATFAKLIGIELVGEGDRSRTGGIRVRGAFGFSLGNCGLGDFGIEAMLIENGVVYITGGAMGGLKNRAFVAARGYRTGSIRVEHATDCIFDGVEFAGGLNPGIGEGVSGPGLTCAAAWFGGMTVSKVSNCVFEVGDIGLASCGLDNTYVACRFDTNGGHGLWLDGSGNTFVAPLLERNGFAAHNSFDHIHATGGGRNLVISPRCTGGAIMGDAYHGNRVRHMIYDDKTDPASNFVNTYHTPQTDESFATSFYHIAGSGEESANVIVEQGGLRRLWGPNPSVLNRSRFVFEQKADTLVIDFRDGVPGQIITLIDQQRGGHVTTLAASRHIRLNRGGAALRLPGTTPAIQFINTGGCGSAATWQQIA